MYRLLSTANITWVFDQHLFRQVSTCTGRYQLPIFHCTIVHPWRYARPLFGCAVFIWCHESQWAHNKIFAHAWHRQHAIFGLKTKTCFCSRFQIRRRTRWSLAIFADRFSQTTSFSPIISMPIIKTSLENPQMSRQRCNVKIHRYYRQPVQWHKNKFLLAQWKLEWHTRFRSWPKVWHTQT